jgi:uncharacterized protein
MCVSLPVVLRCGHAWLCNNFIRKSCPVKGSLWSPHRPPKIGRSESLIEYPSQFPIKVMGQKVDGLVDALTVIAKNFDPSFDASTLELRESQGGNYLGVTITITATSRDQLDELYRTLSTHPMVKVVL